MTEALNVRAAASGWWRAAPDAYHFYFYLVAGLAVAAAAPGAREAEQL